MSNYRKMFEQAILAQQAQDPAQKQLEDQIMQQPTGASMAPTLGLIDHLSGSNLAAQAPKTVDKKEQLAQLLQARQGAASQKLSGLGQLAKMQNESEQNAMERAFKEKMYGMQMVNAQAKLAKANGSGGRKLGSEDIKSINNIDAMIADIPKLKNALARGEKIMPEVFGIQVGGDNEASAARKRIKEYFGRNQSGGAIGTQEAKDFYEIISSVTDSDEMKNQKLDTLYNDVLNRRNSFYYGPSAQPNVPQQNPGVRGPATNAPTNFDPSTADEATLDAWLAMQNGG